MTSLVQIIIVISLYWDPSVSRDAQVSDKGSRNHPLSTYYPAEHTQNAPQYPAISEMGVHYDGSFSQKNHEENYKTKSHFHKKSSFSDLGDLEPIQNLGIMLSPHGSQIENMEEGCGCPTGEQGECNCQNDQQPGEYPPIYNKDILEYTATCTASMINQLNVRCDALENELNKQFRIITQPVSSQPAWKTATTQWASMASSLNEVVINVRGFYGSFNNFQQLLSSQTSALTNTAVNMSQIVQSLRTEINSEISRTSHQIFQRFNVLEKKMDGQYQNIIDLLYRSPGNVQPGHTSFGDTTKTHQVLQQLSSIMNQLYKNSVDTQQAVIQLSNKINAAEPPLDNIKHGVGNMLSEQINRRLNMIEQTLRNTHNLIISQMGNYGNQNGGFQKQLAGMAFTLSSIQTTVAGLHGVKGGTGLSCGCDFITQMMDRMAREVQQNYKSLFSLISRTNDNPAGATNMNWIMNQIGRIAGSLTQLEGQCRGLHGGVSGNGTSQKFQALTMREWEQIKAQWEQLRSKIVVQLNKYQKALDVRQCPQRMIMTTPRTKSEQHYIITSQPLRD